MFEAPYQDPSPDRLEVRTTSGLKRKIQAAAELVRRSSTELILEAADKEATYILGRAAIAARRSSPGQSLQPGEHFIFHVRERGSDGRWRNQHLLASIGGRYDLLGAFTQIGFGAWDTIGVLRSFTHSSGIYEAEDPDEVTTLIRRLGGDRTTEDAMRFKDEIDELFIALGLAERSGKNVQILGGMGELRIQPDNTWLWWLLPASGVTHIDNLDPQRALYQILRFTLSASGKAFAAAEVQLDIPYATANTATIGLVRFMSHGNERYTVLDAEANHGPAKFADVDFGTALTALSGIPPILLRARILDAIDRLNKVLEHIHLSSAISKNA